MKQYRISAANFHQSGEQHIPDAHLDQQDLAEIQRLAGINTGPSLSKLEGINISNTGNEKAELMRKHNIKPGTPEWFQLWFSLPYMTGEKPVDK
jgi:hypothetical protein